MSTPTAAQIQELLQQHTARLPTERRCERGWPVEVRVAEVRQITPVLEGWHAVALVLFTEQFTPGCGGPAQQMPRHLECRVTLDASATRLLHAEAIEPEAIDEF